MSETEFVLFQNIIGGIETFLYAVCLTAFFYPFMTEKKERQGSKLKKILIVFGSYIAISLIGNFVPAYGWLGLMIVIILLQKYHFSKQIICVMMQARKGGDYHVFYGDYIFLH